MGKYLKLIRVKHYLKNALLFIPLFFNGVMFLCDANVYVRLIFGFLAFSCIASFVYVLNDIKDREKDRLHPTKKNRPIANGSISVGKALVLAAFLFLLAISFALATGKYQTIIYIILYCVLNICYSMGLKNKPILDIVILVSGFLLRVVYGAALADIEVSAWMYLTIITGAAYMGLGKRRKELESQQDGTTRNVLKYYTYGFLDKYMYMCLTLTIMFFALWAMNHEKEKMIWLVPLLMMCTMKYSLNVEKNPDGDPIEVILGDKWMLVLGIVFCVIMLLVLYIV